MYTLKDIQFLTMPDDAKAEPLPPFETLAAAGKAALKTWPTLPASGKLVRHVIDKDGNLAISLMPVLTPVPVAPELPDQTTVKPFNVMAVDNSGHWCELRILWPDKGSDSRDNSYVVIKMSSDKMQRWWE